jgi:hypothetical protein
MPEPFETVCVELLQQAGINGIRGKSDALHANSSPFHDTLASE